MKTINVGVLAFHGDVIEHIQATTLAAKKMRVNAVVTEVRTRDDLKNLDALIIPGGESPTLQKLCQRENMWADMKKVKHIFGTCAGAIMLSKTVGNSAEGQQSLELMDIEIERNAYGRQTDSFEETIATKLGNIDAVFIRAPKIKTVGKGVNMLSERNGEIVACEQKQMDTFYLATTFHPELTTTKLHEYFLTQIN